MNPLFLRRRFRRELARQTPLIEGYETKTIAGKIDYSPDRAVRIITGDVVDFEPRETFFARLVVALESPADILP